MSIELTPLELARDEVSNAVAVWITAAQAGGEESAITRFDEALAVFEATVRLDAHAQEGAPPFVAEYELAAISDLEGALSDSLTTGEGRVYLSNSVADTLVAVIRRLRGPSPAEERAP